MSINKEKLLKLNELVKMSFRKKHIIVLNPEGQQEIQDDPNANIIYDVAKWDIPNEEISSLVSELSENRELSNEEKILAIYEKLCQEYVYDDNLLSYIHKVDDDSYSLPDFYGRDIDQEWEKNRGQHNRRVCYEVSRYLAKALTELFKDNEDIDVSILWDKGLTHYFVGLTCSDYTVTLDIDDFNNIKDMTRLKTGLTTEGIRILEDNQSKFQTALSKFNEGRIKEAIKKIEGTRAIEESENIIFLKNVIEILKEEYNIDSQGLFEYIKEIVDIKIGPESRKKVWKEIKGNDTEETRYIRCLILDMDNQKYIIDVDQMILRQFDEEEFKKEDSEFIPYKKLLSEEVIDYRCRLENRYKGR